MAACSCSRTAPRRAARWRVVAQHRRRCSRSPLPAPGWSRTPHWQSQSRSCRRRPSRRSSRRRLDGRVRDERCRRWNRTHEAGASPVSLQHSAKRALGRRACEKKTEGTQERVATVKALCRHDCRTMESIFLLSAYRAPGAPTGEHCCKAILPGVSRGQPPTARRSAFRVTFRRTAVSKTEKR